MTFTVSPWLVWAGASLVLFGAWFLGGQAAAAVKYLLGRWSDPGEDGGGWDWPDDGPFDDSPLEELPPERTWEQMTSHQLPIFDTQRPEFWTPENIALLRPDRERRAPEWEVDQRQHYAAMGFDFPSGLMARVREAAQ